MVFLLLYDIIQLSNFLCACVCEIPGTHTRTHTHIHTPSNTSYRNTELAFTRCDLAYEVARIWLILQM